MNALDELEEIKELVNDDKKFKYKNIVNFNCDGIKEELEYADKMHKLEIEMNLPLEMLVIGFKALKNGIYYKENDTISYHNVRGITEKGIEVISNICSYGECDFGLSFADYKKTWWLKEDMSE